jgi:hypothetical protein
MRLKFSSLLPCSAERAWARERRLDFLNRISRPLLTFDIAEPAPAPETWQADADISLAARLFGLVPVGRQHIRVTRLDEAARSIETEESGGLVRVWRHRAIITPIGETSCRHDDIIEFQAGLWAPLVWLTAQVLYRYRHRCRKKAAI